MTKCAIFMCVTKSIDGGHRANKAHVEYHAWNESIYRAFFGGRKCTAFDDLPFLVECHTCKLLFHRTRSSSNRETVPYVIMMRYSGILHLLRNKDISTARMPHEGTRVSASFEWAKIDDHIDRRDCEHTLGVSTIHKSPGDGTYMWRNAYEETSMA